MRPGVYSSHEGSDRIECRDSQRRGAEGSFGGGWGGGKGRRGVEERFEQWVQPSRLVDFSTASSLNGGVRRGVWDGFEGGVGLN